MFKRGRMNFLDFESTFTLVLLFVTTYHFNLRRVVKQTKMETKSIIPSTSEVNKMAVSAKNLIKGKAVPLHAMEALGERGGIAPTHSRPRHQMGVSGQRHAPVALLPPGKGPPVPIVQETGWAPEPVRTQRLQENSFAPARDRTPIARSSSP
jgi:hypothetical protein